MPPPSLEKSKLPPQHLILAERFRAERLAERFSQAELAAELGLTREGIGNYEYGLAKIPFSVGWAFCQRLDLNPRWLATGKEPQRPFISATELEINEATLEKASARSVDFLRGYASYLRPAIEKWLKTNTPQQIVLRLIQGGPAAAARRASFDELEIQLLEYFALLKTADVKKKLAFVPLVEAFLFELRSRLENRSRRRS